MGCSQSKIENEESLRRCKERKFHMTAAVSSRNAFAAAHSAYAIALKNTGAALHDFAQGEAPHPNPHPHPPSSSAAAPLPPAAAAAVQPPIENFPPPPPPVPDFNLSPLQRSASMPDLALPVKKKPPLDPDASILEEDEDQDEDEIADALAAAASPPPPPKADPPKATPPRAAVPPPGMESTWDYFFGMGPDGIPVPTDPPPPEPAPSPAPAPAPAPAKAAKKQKAPGGGAAEAGEVHHKHAASAGAGGGEGKAGMGTGIGTGTGTSTGGGEGKRGRMVAAAGKKVSFLEVMSAVDEDFLKAYESAHEVSKMLEATRMHYHSNFADNRGHIDHAARVMRVITWNRSLKGIPNQDDGKDDINSDDSETHATILDKMLAWEKKLYDEMKAGELMKIEYQRKVALLNKQKKRSGNHEALERTKSAVSHLHTRYIVDMQSMDSTVSEISHLRDNRLYPKLVELVDGMATMWGTMYVHHSAQLKAVADLRYLDAVVVPKETSEQHHEQTIQLLEVLREWHSQFEKLMTNLKAYIGALNNWLKLNLIPIESSLKEKVSSPPRIIQPAIQILLHAWHDQMEKLPDALARGAILSFSAVVHTIVVHQEEELKHREKCEKTRREYLRESRNFDDWYHKHLHRAEKKAASSTAEAEEPERAEGAEQVDPVEERRIAVETIKVRLESEVESHQRMCKQVREKSLGSLKTHLPELFRAMSDFAYATSEMYKSLRSISQNQTDN